MNIKPSSMRLVAINLAAIVALVVALLWVGPWEGEKPAVAGGAEAVKFDAKLAETGKSLSESNGCIGCHSIGGESGAGPTWKGFYGSIGKRGKTVDDKYVADTLATPPAAMANFKGKFSEDDSAAFTEYIKSLAK